MEDILFNIFSFIVAGYLLRFFKILNDEAGDILLKIVFYFTLPFLIINVFSNINLKPEYFLFPIIASCVYLITFYIADFYSKSIEEPETRNSFVLTSIIMNIGFCLPFVHEKYGNSGIVVLFLFDFANALLTYTLAYYIAFRNKQQPPVNRLKKILTSPPFLALIAGLFLNISGVSLTLVNSKAWISIGNLTIPLVLLSLGFFFNPRIIRIKLVIDSIIIRSIIGGAAGFLLSKLFQLNEPQTLICTFCAAAPAGYNSLTFSSIAGLDKTFASNTLSFSIFLGLIFALIFIFI